MQAGDYDVDAVRSKVEKLIQDTPVMVFSWSGCPFCKKAKALLSDVGAQYTALELDTMGQEGKAMRAELAKVRSPCQMWMRTLWQQCTIWQYRADNSRSSLMLAQMTDRTSMPSIWISGSLVGGCNDGPGVVPLHQQGKLVQLLQGAGAV